MKAFYFLQIYSKRFTKFYKISTPRRNQIHSNLDQKPFKTSKKNLSPFLARPSSLSVRPISRLAPQAMAFGRLATSCAPSRSRLLRATWIPPPKCESIQRRVTVVSNQKVQVNFRFPWVKMSHGSLLPRDVLYPSHRHHRPALRRLLQPALCCSYLAHDPTHLTHAHFPLYSPSIRGLTCPNGHYHH
jgi:hypothetical protein